MTVRKHARWALTIAACGSVALATASVPAAQAAVPEVRQELFVYTGGQQTFTVPTGVSWVIVELWGGQAVRPSSGLRAVDAWGGSVSGRLDVTPGETLTVVVGDVGSYGGLDGKNLKPAYNGGGANAACANERGYNAYSAGGGGAADVRRGGTGLGNRIAVAGGAGGKGLSRTATFLGGGGGASIGGSGTGPSFGRGGTQAAGGAAGGSGLDVGKPGTLGNGGPAVNCSGAGGGGYYGGGSGGKGNFETQSSGGGGGSNYVGPLTRATSRQNDASLANDSGWQLAVEYAHEVGAMARISYIQP